MGLAQRAKPQHMGLDWYEIEGKKFLPTGDVPDEALEYLSWLHAEASDGYITVVRKNNAMRSGIQFYHVPFEDLAELVAHYGRNGMEDIYVSMNTFWRPERKVKYAHQLRAIWVDLDCYNVHLTPGQALQSLEVHVFGRFLPWPTLVVKSGRGLYAIWLLPSYAPAKVRPVRSLWRAVERFYANTLKEYGADKKSTDAARFLRLPGTVNTKNGATVEILRRYGRRYSLQELQEWLPPIPSRAEREAAKAARKKAPKAKTSARPKGTSNVSTLRSMKNLHYTRARDIEALMEMRGGRMHECREFAAFIYRLELRRAGESEQEAQEKMDWLVRRFVRTEDDDGPYTVEDALRDTADVDKIVAGAEGYACCHYSNARIIEELNITPEQQQQLKTIIGAAEKTERNKAHKKAKRRNDSGLTKREQARQDNLRAVADGLARGLTQAAIASERGISLRYVKRMAAELRGCTETSPTLERPEAILAQISTACVLPPLALPAGSAETGEGSAVRSPAAPVSPRRDRLSRSVSVGEEVEGVSPEGLDEVLWGWREAAAGCG